MNGFLEAVNDQQGSVVLDQRVPRARFGLHLKLAELTDKIDRALLAGDASETARLMSVYFFEVGLSIEDRPGKDVLIAYLQLSRLNRVKWVLPFQQWQGPPMELEVYEYEGRTFAWWIHKLASRYGWTREQIFNLWPEEVACYLQEILVSEFDEHDDRRALSELGYTYDKETGKGTFKPTPRPGWMVKQRPEKKIRIRKDMLPVGNVIKLDELYKDQIIH